MENREKLKDILKRGSLKHLEKLFKDLPPRSVLSRVNEELDGDGTTPLLHCVKCAGVGFAESGNSYTDCCIYLIRNGAKVGTKDAKGKTALYYAASNKNDRLAQTLLSVGADPLVKNSSGVTVLGVAIQTGAAGTVKKIIEQHEELINEIDGTGCPPLILTLQLSNDDLTNHLLDKGADVNIQEERSHRTALHYALYMKKYDIFEKIVSLNPKWELTDYKKTTVIHRASAVHDVRYLKSTFDSKMPPNSLILNMLDCDGANAVMLACQNGNIEHLRLLADHAASVSAMDKCGRTALHHCVENTSTDCAEYLLKKDTSLLNTGDNEGLTPLHMSAITGNEALLHLLLKKGANLTCLDEEKHTVAHWATVSGQTEVLDILIEHGAELSSPDRHHAYPIHYAAQMAGRRSRPPVDGNHGTILKQLLDHNVDMSVTDKDGRQPLLWAASAGNVEACEILVAAGANVDFTDKDGLTALHCAASRGHTAVIEELITICHANIDSVDKNNCTPLFYAITLGNIDCVKMLMQHGANTSHCDKRGRSPAHCAAIQGSQETLVLLQRKNVDLWSPSQQGDYPIHEAALGGHEGIVKFLIGLRSRTEVVNLSNKEGRNCLHIAALTDNLALCQLLLDSGANINAIMKNKGKYYTAVDVASLKEHKETEQYLISKGGRTGYDVTNDAAIIIQRNLKLRNIFLRPKSPKHRFRSRKLKQVNKLEVINSDKGEDNESDCDITEGENDSEKNGVCQNKVKVVISVQDFNESEDHDETDNPKDEKTENGPKIMITNNSSTPVKNNVDKNQPKSSMGTRSKPTMGVKFVNGSEKNESFQDSKHSDNKENYSEKQPRPHSKPSSMQISHDKDHGHEKDGLPGNKNHPNKKVLHRSGKGRRDIASDVQASVRRFEEERRAVRQYHQLKRAQMYTGPLYDVELINKMVDKCHNDDLQSCDNQSQSTAHGDKRNSVTTENEGHKDTDEDSQDMSSSDNYSEEKDNSRQNEHDKEMERIVARTEELFNSLNNRVSSTLQKAKSTNDRLQGTLNTEKHSKATSQEKKEKIQEQRHQKYNEWHKQKSDELHQRLLKAYRPYYSRQQLSRGTSRTPSKRGDSPSRMSASPSSVGQRPPTTQSYHSVPGYRPRYSSSTYSHRQRACSANPDSYTTIMTRHGMSRVRNDSEPKLTWSYNSRSIHSRRGLLFMQPDAYEEKQKQNKKKRDDLILSQEHELGQSTV